MAMSTGTLTVVGTTLVAALAVGVAVGVHTLVGTPEGGSGASVTLSDDYCTLMGQMMNYGVDGAAPLADVTATLEATSNNEAVAIAVLHAQGKQILEIAGPLAAIERHAAEIVMDPALSGAFEASAASLEMTAEVFGAPARDAETVEGFAAHIVAVAADPDIQAIATAGDAANATIIAQVGTECGISLDGKAITNPNPATTMSSTPGATVDPTAGAVDSTAAAIADVSKIGENLAAAFTEWSDGDPLPAVDLVNGTYTIASETTQFSTFPAASRDSAIADEFIVGPTDWCVSVIVMGASSATYSFSAQFGLSEGTCG